MTHERLGHRRDRIRVRFGGALLVMFLNAVLPKHHLASDSRDVIKVATAMIATLSALVVGLLIASAKSSFDSKDGELRGAAARTILLDRTMAEYGPETAEVRHLFRQMVAMRINQIWPNESTGNVDPDAISRGPGIEIIQRKLLELAPRNDAQHWLQSTALQISSSIAEAPGWWPGRPAAVSSGRSWLSWCFGSPSFSPSLASSRPLTNPSGSWANGSVITALLVCALSVAGSIYLIVEMDQPYGGLIKISSAPLRTALDQLGQQ